MQRTATLQCRTCEATRIVPMEKYKVGEVINPYPGGGNYGRCLKCGRTGMRVVEVPRIEPTKPVGWTKVPEA